MHDAALACSTNMITHENILGHCSNIYVKNPKDLPETKILLHCHQVYQVPAPTKFYKNYWYNILHYLSVLSSRFFIITLALNQYPKRWT